MPAYKDEARGTWYVKFQYETWDGVKKAKLKRGFKTKKEALAYERDFLNLKENQNLTVGRLCMMYLEDRRHRVKQTTLLYYQNTISAGILPYFNRKSCKDVTGAEIVKWQNELLDKGLAVATVTRYSNVLGFAWNYGIKFHGLQANPVRLAGVPRKVRSNEIRFWTPEQFEQFIEHLEMDRHKFMYRTLYYSGMRVGECIALKWNDIDWEESTIRVDETLTVIHGEEVVTSPKTPKSNRLIYMPDFWMEWLKEYKSHIYDTSPESRVFPFTTDRSNVRKVLVRAAKKAGLPEISTHDLRHSHASLLIDMGMPITMISERLGHENPAITLQVYSHMFPQRQKDFADKLNKMYQTRITSEA